MVQTELLHARTTDEDVIDHGVTMQYPVASQVLINAVRSHLCTSGCKILSEKREGESFAMRCRAATPSLFDEIGARWNIFKTNKRPKESANPWARVIPVTTGSKPVTEVVIGAELFRDGKQLSSVPDGFFFDPGGWAQGVWEELEPLRKPPK